MLTSKWIYSHSVHAVIGFGKQKVAIVSAINDNFDRSVLHLIIIFFINVLKTEVPYSFVSLCVYIIHMCVCV